MFVEGKDGITDPMLFEVGREDELAEVEPNDARDAPQPIALEGEKPLVINGALQRRKVTELIQDVDFYALKAKKGVPLHLYTVAYQLRAPEIDTVLRVLDSKGKVLAESDDLTAGRGFLMGSADSSLFYVPEQDEEIFVTVLDRVGRGGPNYGGNLVDGAYVLGLFGDVATELCIRSDGDEGLFASYSDVQFRAPVRADFQFHRSSRRRGQPAC